MHAPALLFLLLLLPRPAAAQEMRRIEPMPAQESTRHHDAQPSGTWSIPVALEPDSTDSSWDLPLMGAMLGAGLAIIASNDCGQSTSCISIPIFSAVIGALLGAAVGFVIELAID